MTTTTTTGDGAGMTEADRDFLGRLVRQAWVQWAETQPNPKASWLAPYDDLSEPDREADRQIGEAIARWTLQYGDRLRPRPAPATAAGQRVFTPTPHEPVEGVTLWSPVPHPGIAAYVKVDGVNAGYLGSDGIAFSHSDLPFSPDRFRYPVTQQSTDGYVAKPRWLASLTTLRDRIRAERTAAKPAAEARVEPLDATPVDGWPTSAPAPQPPVEGAGRVVLTLTQEEKDELIQRAINMLRSSLGGQGH
jgi:hypothetical protein